MYKSIFIFSLFLSGNVYASSEITLESRMGLCKFYVPWDVKEKINENREEIKNLANASYEDFIFKGGSGIKLSASKDTTRATIDGTFHSAKHRINVALSGNLDSEQQSTFVNEDGLSSDASVKLKWRIYPNAEKLTRLDDLTKDHYSEYSEMYDKLGTDCKESLRESSEKKIIDGEETIVVSNENYNKVRSEHNKRLNKLNIHLDSYIQKNLTDISSKYYSWNISAEAGRTDFKYLDPISVVVGLPLNFIQSDENDLAVDIGYSMYDTSTSSIFEFGVGYSRQYGYPTGTEREFCREATENASLIECFRAITEAPVKKTSEHVYVNYSKMFTNSVFKAVETKLNFDTEKSRWNVSIPVYFWVNTDSDPIAGVRFDILQDAQDNEDSFQTTLFYSIPLKFN